MAIKNRSHLIRCIGFPSYSIYLESELWASIRRRVIRKAKGRCCSCEAKASQVHHSEYTESNLRGESLDGLHAMCGDCHELVHFNGGKFIDLSDSKDRLGVFVTASEQALPESSYSKRVSEEKKQRAILKEQRRLRAEGKDILIFCCQCTVDVFAQLKTGKDIYPHRKDLRSIPFWQCPHCGNHVGCHHRSKDRTQPLGVIPTPELRKARQHIHKIFDPMWRTKKIGRNEAYVRVAKEMNTWNFHTANIRTIGEARRVYRAVMKVRKDIGMQ